MTAPHAHNNPDFPSVYSATHAKLIVTIICRILLNT